jgi:hypothetical protein
VRAVADLLGRSFAAGDAGLVLDPAELARAWGAEKDDVQAVLADLAREGAVATGAQGARLEAGEPGRRRLADVLRRWTA